jgi:hypothetical protein
MSSFTLNPAALRRSKEQAILLGHVFFATTARHYAKRDSIEKGKAKRSRTFCMDRAPNRQLSKSWPDYLRRLRESERAVQTRSLSCRA